jgi:hypothetical protein
MHLHTPHGEKRGAWPEIARRREKSHPRYTGPRAREQGLCPVRERVDRYIADVISLGAAQSLAMHHASPHVAGSEDVLGAFRQGVAIEAHREVLLLGGPSSPPAYQCRLGWLRDQSGARENSELHMLAKNRHSPSRAPHRLFKVCWSRATQDGVPRGK